MARGKKGKKMNGRKRRGAPFWPLDLHHGGQINGNRKANSDLQTSLDRPCSDNLLQKGKNGLARKLSEITWHLAGGMLSQGHKKKGHHGDGDDAHNTM